MLFGRSASVLPVLSFQKGFQFIGLAAGESVELFGEAGGECIAVRKPFP